jgi:hypothetical protein
VAGLPGRKSRIMGVSSSISSQNRLYHSLKFWQVFFEIFFHSQDERLTNPHKHKGLKKVKKSENFS